MLTAEYAVRDTVCCCRRFEDVDDSVSKQINRTPMMYVLTLSEHVRIVRYARSKLKLHAGGPTLAGLAVVAVPCACMQMGVGG
jgi:hypothetical protein